VQKKYWKWKKKTPTNFSERNLASP